MLQIAEFSGSRKVSIIFQDDWSTSITTVADLTCWEMTDIDCLLQPFKVLRQINKVRIEILTSSVFSSGMDTSHHKRGYNIEAIQGQLRCIEESQNYSDGTIVIPSNVVALGRNPVV